MERKNGTTNKIGKVVVTSTAGEISADGYEFLKLYPRGIVLPVYWEKYGECLKYDEYLLRKKEKPRKQIFNDVDPYGEENWEE